MGAAFDGLMLKRDLNFAQPVLYLSSSPSPLRRYTYLIPRSTFIRAQPYPSEPQTCHLGSHPKFPLRSTYLQYYARLRPTFCVPKLENSFSRNGFKKASGSSGLSLGPGQGSYLCFKSSVPISLVFPLTLSYPSHLSVLLVVLLP